MMRAERMRCKCRYRVRWFYSKGAFLVLVWIMLLTVASISVKNAVKMYGDLLRNNNFILPKWLPAIPLVFGLLGAVFSGWLADAKLGNYKVMKYSFVLLFFISLCFSTYTLVPGIVHYTYVVSVLYCIVGSISVVTVVACLVTSLQLGLDQMPDASSSNITSFIAWFAFSIYAGIWISSFPLLAMKFCSTKSTWFIQLYSLVPPLCTTAVLVSDFILAKQWLLMEPKSPQSLKTIYRVLKFAAKHKAPLNRSALTYWEEDVPSRMDLGKSRYGGPFTTEQVEDVKTILRLFPLCLTLWLLGGSLAIFHPTSFVTWVIQLSSLVPPLCMTVVLVSDLVFAKKWLIIEPKSPQLVKTIYQVLKFAAKHKAPLNRSALTYWEEDVPSRMDLGKSRYGGPFTTEQVEDVKTILRLLPLCLTLWLLGGSLTIFHPTTFVTVFPMGWTTCTSRLLALFTYNSMWCGMIWTVFYEFVIYPVIQNSLPSIIRRIGIISLLITTFSIVFLILELVFYYHSDLMAVDSVIDILHSISKGFLTMLLASNMVELACAQAPYYTRGLFCGCMVLVFISSVIVGYYFPSNIKLTLYGVRAAISLLGFILYCALARWYKRRVRDEEYCTQTVVEEVYDRYLSAQD